MTLIQMNPTGAADAAPDDTGPANLTVNSGGLIPAWAVFERRSVHVALKIRRPSFTGKIQWALLGLDPEIYNDAFTAGVQRFLPILRARELDRIVDLLRKTVADYAPLTAFGRFAKEDEIDKLTDLIANKTLTELRQVTFGSEFSPLAVASGLEGDELAAAQEYDESIKAIWTTQSAADRFMGIADEIGQMRDDIIAEVTQTVSVAILDVKQRQAQLNGESVPESLSDSELETLAESIASRIPTAEVIKSHFEIRLDYGFMRPDRAAYESAIQELLEQTIVPLYDTVVRGIEQRDNKRLSSSWGGALKSAVDNLARSPIADSDAFGNLKAQVDNLIADNPSSVEGKDRAIARLQAIKRQIESDLKINKLRVRMAVDAKDIEADSDAILGDKRRIVPVEVAPEGEAPSILKIRKRGGL